MMCAFRAFLALIISLLSIGLSAAQQKAPESQKAPENDVWTQVTKLDWKFGPIHGNIGAIASIVVPQGSLFLGAADTRRFLELQGNLGADNNYTFGPRDLSWFSVFAFDPSGYVKDDEKIDPDELLATLKQSNAASNEERKRRGLRTLVLESWHVMPHYDVQTKRLEWGTKLRDETGDIQVNYTVRLLGRTGVMSAILVSDPASLDSDMKAFKVALAGFDFAAGQKYSEFRAGDKVAEYGLAALVVGGAAAAAAKGGLFKFLGKFIWVGLFALAGLWAAVRRFFSRSQADQGMLAEIASSTFGFWLVAAAIVAVDQAFLLEPGAFAFSVAGANQARLRVSAAPFTLRDKELVSSLLSFPFQLFFVCSPDAPSRTRRQAQRLLARMQVLSGRNAPFAVLSMLAALILLAGPFISVSRGVAFSIVALLPVLYLLSIAAAVLLWQMRKRYGLSNGAALKLAAELVLCPVLVVNVSKRLSLCQVPRLNPSNAASCSANPDQSLAAICDNQRYYRGE